MKRSDIEVDHRHAPEMRAGAVLLVTILAMAVITGPVQGAVPPGIELRRGHVQPAFPRAETTTHLVVEVRNSDEARTAVTVHVVLPSGVATSTPVKQIDDWKPLETRQLNWEVTAAEPVSGEARVTFRQEDSVLASWTWRVRWHEARSVTAVDHVPPPEAVDTGPYLVGAIHCPLWKGGRCWQAIADYPDREPVLGFYDEGDPEVTDWEIKWALEHGISFFLTCWYRAKDNFDRPVEPALEHWLHEGLFRCRYGSRMKFAINYENGNRHFCGQTSEQDLLENLLPYWIENYFRKPNYLTLDRKPVLAVYNVGKFVEDLGGESHAGRVIQSMHEACRAAGFDGLCLLGQYCWGAPAGLRQQAEQVRRIGMDAGWAYHWPTFTGAFGESLRPSGLEAMAAQQRLWKTLPQPNVLTLSVGWDSEPWRFSQTRVQWQLTPREFETLCRHAVATLEQRSSVGIGGRLVLLDNWNEFGEGHYLLPTRKYGFDYLEAVRKVFAPDAPEHTDVVPTDVGLGPYDSAYRAYRAE